MPGQFQICRPSDGTIIIPSVIICRTMFARMRGLLGRTELPAGEGMFLSPCRSIHTILMRFSIDVIFLTNEGVVCRIVRDVKPCRFALGGYVAHSAIEVQRGWLLDSALSLGDMLQITHAPDL